MASTYPGTLDSFSTGHVDNVAEVIHASTVNDLADAVNRIEKANGPLFGVKVYGAVGDGVTDDTSAIAAAISAAGGTGTVWSPPGKTYLVSASLVLSSTNARLDFSGSTIKKKATMTTEALTVSGSSIDVRGVVIDGNRAGGATGPGITWTGANGRLLDSTSSHNKTVGVFVTGAGAVLSCWRVTASDNVNAAASGDGFYASTSGLLRTYDCVADQNARAGYAFDVSAADGCVLNGSAYQNAISGAHIYSAKGHSAYFYAEDSGFYGMNMAGNRWGFDYVEVYRSGFSTSEPTANGIELFAATYNSFGTLVAKGIPGYSVAFAGSGTIGSSYNRFGSVLADATDGTNANPGIIYSGGTVTGSTHNSIGTAYVKGHTVAVNFGETLNGGNDHNTIGFLHAEDSGYGCAWFGTGSYNRIGTIVSRNCFTSDATIVGLVSFINTTTTTDNVVGVLDHRTATGTKPKYLVYAAAGTSRNRVEQIRSRGDYQTNIASLAGTDNVAGPIGVQPNGVIAETVPRSTVTSNVIGGLVTQTLTLVACFLPEGTKITQIAFVSGTTAAGTPTNQWFALYDKNRVLLGTTADDTTTAWAANTAKTLTLSAAQTTTYEGLYYLGCMVKATTVPTMHAAPITAQINALVPILAGTSTAALTNPASAPGTAAAISPFAALPYAYVV